MKTCECPQGGRKRLTASLERNLSPRLSQSLASFADRKGKGGAPSCGGMKAQLVLYGLIWVVLCYSPLLASAENQPEEARAGRWSPWSDVKDGLQMRIFAPREMNRQSDWPFEYFAVCEVRNTSSEPQTFIRRGRIYATDTENREWMTSRMMNYESRVAPGVTLPPGGSVVWRQEGMGTGGPSEGAVDVAVELEPFRLRSPALAVELCREWPADAPSQHELRVQLERKAAVAPLYRPELGDTPAFHAVKTADLLVQVKGGWYFGVKCRVPEGADRLRVALGPDVVGHIGINMLPVDASLPELSFYSDMRTGMKTGILTESVESIGDTGDCFKLIDFDLVSGFEPGTEFWICWRVQDDFETQAAFLLHFIDRDASTMEDFYKVMFEGKMILTR